MTRSVPATSALLLVTVAALAQPLGARAADLPSRYQPPEPYYNPTPIFAWTGFYAGVNGQFGFGSFTGGGGPLFGTPVGGLGGVTGGYNFQSGQLLVGVEADADFGSISSSGSYATGINATGTMNGIGTIRGRLGYVWDRTLFYVTGGYAGTMLNAKVSDYSGSPAFVLNESHYLNGYAVGAGVEYALTTRWSVKGEYIFDGFGSQGFFGGTRDAIQAGANISTVRLGVNYHFN